MRIRYFIAFECSFIYNFASAFVLEGRVKCCLVGLGQPVVESESDGDRVGER